MERPFSVLQENGCRDTELNYSSGDSSNTGSEKQVYYSCQDFIFIFLSLSEESLNPSSLESSEAE